MKEEVIHGDCLIEMQKIPDREAFNEIVECGDCSVLTGYMLVNKKLGIYLAPDEPNFWATEEQAVAYAKKWSLAKLYKPIASYTHFD